MTHSNILWNPGVQGGERSMAVAAAADLGIEKKRKIFDTFFRNRGLTLILSIFDVKF